MYFVVRDRRYEGNFYDQVGRLIMILEWSDWALLEFDFGYGPIRRLIHRDNIEELPMC